MKHNLCIELHEMYPIAIPHSRSRTLSIALTVLSAMYLTCSAVTVYAGARTRWSPLKPSTAPAKPAQWFARVECIRRETHP
jgi:hypothetical protein